MDDYPDADRWGYALYCEGDSARRSAAANPQISVPTSAPPMTRSANWCPA